MEFLDPEKILDGLDLKADMIVAEFGCGSSGFVISLAKRLDEGLVYGLDIQEAPLSALKSRSLLENITNIRLIRCNLEKEKGSTLTDSSLDLVLIPNVFFQIKSKDVIIAEANRVLKKRGKLVIIDWLPEATQGPAQGRVSAKEMEGLAEKFGFKRTKEIEAGKYHYCLLFEKI